ncbi:hypothetical protein HMPREF1370_02920, partial [Enterococcus faecium P1123]
TTHQSLLTKSQKDKVATVACMNKLLKCMHAMVRAHTEYDYAYAVSVDH